MTNEHSPNDEVDETLANEDPIGHSEPDVEATDVVEDPASELSDPESSVDTDAGPSADVVDEGSTSLSNAALAFVAFAMLVLVGGAVFVVGSLLAQDEQIAVAQADAEAEIAAYDPDEFATEFSGDASLDGEPESEIIEPTTTTVPESVALAEEVDGDTPADAEGLDSDEDEEEIDTTIPLIDPNDTALVFINRVPGDEYGHVGYVNLAGERFITPLPCDRIDWNRNGGICLQGGSIGVSARGLLLDETLRPQGRFGIATPSRAAISPDGGAVSWTGFVTGHDYLAAGEFATTTQLIDVERQASAELESDFSTIGADGEQLAVVDENYWGTTYIDSQTFYATVGFGTETNLVFGDVQTGVLEIVHESASCPEISPDGTTIVAKTQRGQSFQLIAINTETGARRDLAETRSVDDQVEWIDNNTIVYGLPNAEGGTVGQPALDIWVLNVNDGSAPRLLLPFADSPAAA